MNKKFLSIAASLLLALPLTVAAAPSPEKEAEATADDGTSVTVVTDASKLPAGWENSDEPIIVVSSSGTDADSVRIANSNGDISKMANSWQPALKNVKFVTFWDVVANKAAKNKVLNNGRKVTITVPYSGAIKALYHVTGNVGYEFGYTRGAGTISWQIDANLSPFVAFAEGTYSSKADTTPTATPASTGGKTPGTSDSNSSVLWGSIAMISLACAAGIVVARKRNA